MNEQPFCVSSAVHTRVPGVLVNHLWKLALDGPGCERQLFLLQEGTLAGQPVQEILHRTVGKEPRRYRVFGFDPVTCAVCVRQTEAGAAMFLEGEGGGMGQTA